MNKKGKTIGLTILFILDILLVFVYSLTIQFGWNNILTTIIPVNAISLAQAFGLILVSELLFKDPAKPKSSNEESDLEQSFKYTINYLLNLGLAYFLMWVVTLFL